jgi:diguanylate cyclase (GGDEF)-like protein
MENKVSGSVLILDDDAIFCSFIGELFRDRGLSVAEARSVSEASTLIEQADPILALVDYKMPESDGITWITKIRKEGRKFPVVLLSGTWCDEKTFTWLRNILQVSLFLRKPIEPDLFIQQIEGLLPTKLLHKSYMDNTLVSGENLVAENEHPADHRPPFIDLSATASGAPSGHLNVPGATDRQEKLKVVRANYAKELAQSWDELSRKVSLVQQQPDNAPSKHEAINMAHKLRGTAGSIGFVEAGIAAGRVEDLLHGIDPTDTLREIVWTEIFRALADGETAVRQAMQTDGGTQRKMPGGHESKVLFLGAKNEYDNKIHDLAGKWAAELHLVENPLAFRQKTSEVNYDAAILDLSMCGKRELFDLTQAIRLVPGQKCLPLAFICGESPPISQVDIAYAGGSVSIDCLPEKKDLEQVTDLLLSLRALQKPRILTIDDDQVLTQFIDTILSEGGMSVKQLNNPIAIMPSLDQFKPDLILLDVIMPGLSGYDVCRMLRANEQWSSIPVVFLTSRNDQEGRASAFRAGGNDFLSKPVLAEELLTRVRAQLSLASRGKTNALTDELTGVLKTGAFLESGTSMLNRAVKNGLRLTVCAMTVDDCVSLHLRHGWASMQRALSALAVLIQSRFKSEDLRGRLGEDGFAMAFLSETNDTISQSMERLLEEFAALEFASDNGGTFKATFSTGLSTYPRDIQDFQSLVNIANRRLVSNQLQRRGITVPAV